MEYQSMILSYDRILRKRNIVNKSDTEWSWSLNTPCKSFRGFLALFGLEEPYKQDTSRFYNTKIEKVSVVIEGSSNELYSQGLRRSSNATRSVSTLLTGSKRMKHQ